jgi:hypothetical protein
MLKRVWCSYAHLKSGPFIPHLSVRVIFFIFRSHLSFPFFCLPPTAVYGRGVTDRAREDLVPPVAAALFANEVEPVRLPCGAAHIGRALLLPPCPPTLTGSRRLSYSHLAASSPIELVVIATADGEEVGEALESKSGLVRVLA